MTKQEDALTNLLKTELSSVNQGILKKRKSLADLLKALYLKRVTTLLR